MADKNIISGMILEGSRFEGKLTFKNQMRIEGEFYGEIESDHELIIGKTAQVNADIRVGKLVVMGELSGTVSSCTTLQIQDGGKVLADVCVQELDVQPGALFDGKCAMMTKDR